MVFSEIIGADDPDDVIGDLRVKPALRTLVYDQARLVTQDSVGGWDEYALRQGFPNRREVIHWYQRAVVRTFGHIADAWEPKDCVADQTMLSAVIHRDDNRPKRMPDDAARSFRQYLESVVVQPACNKAYTDIRTKAMEYVKSESEDGSTWTPRDLDPSNQAAIAMRPGFQSVDEQQDAALRQLWGGFTDTNSLLDWSMALNSPTNGEIPSDFSEKITTDEVAMKYLVHDRDADRARAYREAFAASWLLPAFVDGVVAMDASELAQTTSDGSVTLRDE